LICLSALIPLAGCGDNGTTGGCTAVTSGSEGKNVANTLVVPMEKSMFAMDLNGDNKPDNQLGSIIGALTAQNLDVQMGVNQALMDGSVSLLLDQTASDLSNSSCGQVAIQVGNKPATAPKYDGTDVYTINAGVGSGKVIGTISNGFFNSNSPVTATSQTEAQLTVQLPLVAMAAPINLTIHGGHLQFTRMGDGLMKGQINGAIKNSDVQNSIIPSVASILTDKVCPLPGRAMNPPVCMGTGMAGTNQQILDIFDTGGTAQPGDNCMNADGTPSCKNQAASAADFGKCAQKGDKIISTCEVATNSLIKNVLAPDVQMFNSTVTMDASGKPVLMEGTTYMPSAANTAKDSLSLGLSFTAVKASF
jgi:hypothetical protein